MMRVVARTFLIIFAIIAVLGAAYQIAIHTDAGQRWLETRQPDTISQIAIVEFQSRFESDGALRTAWADFTIVNGNPFPIGGIILRCDFQGASGTKINEVSVHMMGDVVPATGQKAYKHATLGFVSSETRNARCAMADAHRHY